MAKQSQEVVDYVRQKLAETNEKNKATADKGRRVKLFNEGDEVMIFLRKKRETGLRPRPSNPAELPKRPPLSTPQPKVKLGKTSKGVRVRVSVAKNPRV
ncbi:hypothetical protein Vadar_014809 [Vaccinium darrowii]|uniref:Uncharacterized protein n=1 Tax=Vaccinium darrowii TaxID=229202 RepID=A0ACB7XIR5_9ERIC|nr:hypothetical protein Vadar_014809 [Vaccinium darrowii]